MQGPISFGRWLKQRRKALELTQDDLARLVNCSGITIRKIEANERRPSRQIAELLADRLEIAPSDRAAFLQFARGEADEQRHAEQPADQQRHPAQWRASQRPTNLARPLHPLIARAQEIAALRQLLLHGDARLLTITGPGGIGKTRLAQEVAYHLLDDFTDGVFLVALETLSDPSQVAATIAQTLGMVDASPQPARARLLDHLCDKHLLLVLDNFEHLLAAAPLVTDLLTTCPWLHILTTSRAPLHLRGERQFSVPPLPLPEPQQTVDFEALEHFGAVALFSARAQAARPGWTLTEQNAPAVVALCAHLDGLPLAIELAAAHTRLLSPHEMLEQIRGKPAMLSGGFRDLPTRQQALRSTIDWSYNLLDQQTRHIFARLAVFNGGCTLQAALAVCDDGAQAIHNLLDQLSILVDQNLLQREEMPDGTSRFVMLNTIREYAREKLAADNQAHDMQERHLQYFLSVAESAELCLRGTEQVACVALLEHEHNNFQAALEWCRAAPERAEAGLRLAGALGEFWAIHSYLSLGRSWLEAFLTGDRGAPDVVRAKALRYAGILASMQGDSAQAMVWDQETLHLCRQLGDTWGMCYSLADLGWVQVWHDCEPEQGRVLLEESLALSRQVGDPWLIARVAWRVGMYCYYFGHDPQQARALLEESLALSRMVGDTWNISNVLVHLSNALWSQQQDRRAIQLAEEALTLAQMVGNQRSIASAYNMLGTVALADGDYEQAHAYHAKSLQLAQALGLPLQIITARYLLGRVALSQRNFPEAQVYFMQCVGACQELNDKLRVAMCLIALAGVAQGMAQTRRAVRLLGATITVLELIDARLEGADRKDYERYLAATRAQLDHTSWADAWAEGRAMSFDQAIVYALEDTSESIAAALLELD
ncbi:MAG TPA: tetratricopeptide repeat protein [Herpetosiphonaceae bacterium]